MALMLFFSLLILFSTVFADNNDRFCLNDTETNERFQGINDNCFQFVGNQKLNFDQASQYCIQQGGHLAMIKSEAINTFLIKKLKTFYKFHGQVWIGLNDRKEESVYRWSDGTVAKYNKIDRTKMATHFDFDVDCISLDVGKNIWKESMCGTGVFSYMQRKFKFVCGFSEDWITTTVAPCPNLTCELDCGLEGYKMDRKGCLKCECDDS